MTAPLTSKKEDETVNSTLADSVPSFPPQSFSQTLHLFFLFFNKHCFNLARAEMLLRIRQSMGGDQAGGRNLHVPAGGRAGGLGGCADGLGDAGKTTAGSV